MSPKDQAVFDRINAALRDSVNLQAFEAVVRTGEGTLDNDGFRRMFGGELFDVTNGWQHPKRAITKMHGGKPLTSTAAGAGQFLKGTWFEIADKYDIPDFSPAWQRFGIAALIYRRGAFDDVLAGRLDQALSKCAKEWASLPGSPYGQPTISRERCREVFYAHGGTVVDSAELPKGPVMAPLVLPLLQIASSLIPQLASMFGSGSEVANRNVAAGQLVADALIKTTQAVNLQDAVEKIQNDPQALADARSAVSEVVMSLSEAGSGGIDGARKAALASDGDWRKAFLSPAFAVALAVLPMVYMVVGAALFKADFIESMTSEMRMAVISSVIGLVLGSLMGFFYGTSYGSQKKDAALGR